MEAPAATLVVSSVLMGFRSLVALTLLLLASCEPQDVPLASYELSGRVTVLLESDAEGGAIANARVIFTSDTLLRQETTTDEDGRYRMRIETDHLFGQVRAEAAGFRPNEETVYFDSPMRRVDIALRRIAE